MILKKLIQNNYIKKYMIILFFLISILISQNWIFFLYDSTKNDDFLKYHQSVLYFLGQNYEISFGQGTLYYYLVSRFLKPNLEYLNINTADFIFSSAIQNLNFILFFLSLLGCYLIMSSENLKFIKRISILIWLSFLPQLIHSRIVMKPEMFGVFLFIWSFYFLNLYKKSREILYVYLSVPFLVMLMTLKLSISFMVTIFLILNFSEFLKLNELKKIFIPLFLCLIGTFISLYENYQITDKQFWDRPYDAEYQYKANPNIIFKANLIEVFTNPSFKGDSTKKIKSIHSDKVLNILLLDTMGDHFNQYFDDDINHFHMDRKKLFASGSKLSINESNQIVLKNNFSNKLNKNLDNFRKLISAIMSSIFFIFIIKKSFNDRNRRIIYLTPFIGVFVLYLSSLGLGGLNFNFYKGDTFKTIYFVFFIVLSFLYLMISFLKKYKFIKINSFLVLFIICIFFISGNPKADTQQSFERKIANNELSLYCEVNNLILFDNKAIDSIIYRANTKSLTSDCKTKTHSLNYYENLNNYDIEKLNLNCANSLNIQNQKLCSYDKLIRNKSSVFQQNDIPSFALFVLIIVLTIVLSVSLLEIKKINE